MQRDILPDSSVHHQKKNILAIDWGKVHIGLAYNKKDNTIVFPIGSLDNNDVVLYNIAHIVSQYNIEKIIIGSPRNQEDLIKHIDAFIKNLSFVLPIECEIQKVNEDYSSIQANAHIDTYKKTAAEDSLAAAYILEEYRRKER